MHIHSGIHTDRFAQQTESPFGEITLGRAGLLNVLEPQLDLRRMDLGRTRSLIACRAGQKNAQTRPCIYDASFRADPIGGTRALPQSRAVVRV